MKHIAKAVLTVSALVIAAPAEGQYLKPEIRPFAGAYIPAASQRDLFKNAPMFGVQAALELESNFHLLGTFGWARSDNKYVTADNSTNIFQYDIGAELGFVRPLGVDWLLKPFAGLGAGGRTYVYESETLRTRTCAAGYGALGSELQFARVALRLEARDNVFCYKPPIEGVKSKTRTDVSVAFGLAYHFK